MKLEGTPQVQFTSQGTANVNNCSVKPLHDFVLVRKISNEAILDSGLIIPETLKFDAYYGVIAEASEAARGRDGQLTPLMVKKGDHIMYVVEDPPSIKVGDEDLYFVKEEQIFCVLIPNIVQN